MDAMPGVWDDARLGPAAVERDERFVALAAEDAARHCFQEIGIAALPPQAPGDESLIKMAAVEVLAHGDDLFAQRLVGCQ
jgi:hypothetical protein